MDLVIFDCDGVLVDSEPIGARIGATVLTSLGWEVSADQVMERFLGRSEEYFQAEVERELGRPLPSGWDDEFEHLYDAAYATELEPVEGIVEPCSTSWRSAAIATCVASNGSHDKMRRTLGVTGLHERFEGRIFSAQDVRLGQARAGPLPARRRAPWASSPAGAWWSRTARPASPRRARQACAASGMPPSPLPTGWPGRASRCARRWPTCGDELLGIARRPDVTRHPA